ncbi:MAG: pyridoxal-phosphate dependent enzyme [Planctomycetota bacterium]|nr:pyridoxal-phosphate dependent enzyme [Planctomycetota bacterium]
MLQRIQIDVSFTAAAERLAGVVRRTRLAPAAELGLTPGLLRGLGQEAAAARLERLDLRLKLECTQETGSFKARGAWNHMSQLTAAERAAGVVTTSSGNHGRALAWAAGRAGVPATICMPADAYPNKIEACRELGAEVFLGATRPLTDAKCLELAAAGMTLVHPYDSLRTIEGAGTVGAELAEDWPGVEVVVAPIGGGGLIAGTSLALHDRLGDAVRVFGVEPSGAATMSRALAAGEPVDLVEITTGVQGLCPLNVGGLNLQLAKDNVEAVHLLGDEAVFRAQAVYVNHLDLVVEPAGSATLAGVLFEGMLDQLLEGRSADAPLAVALVVSGGNPAPEQLAAVRAGGVR